MVLYGVLLLLYGVVIVLRVFCFVRCLYSVINHVFLCLRWWCMIVLVLDCVFLYCVCLCCVFEISWFSYGAGVCTVVVVLCVFGIVCYYSALLYCGFAVVCV